MPAYTVLDDKMVFKGNIRFAEKKFRPELSHLIKEEFGNRTFKRQDQVRDIIRFCLDFYVEKFKKICHEETSLTFYQNVLWFHEQATEIAVLHKDKELSHKIDHKYISIYRRILKFILETGCEVSMESGEISNQEFINRIDPILNDLLFIGEMILSFVNFYAEQSMIEDVIVVSFDDEGKYNFSRNHHFESIFGHIIEELGSSLYKTVVDETELYGIQDLKKSIKNCFNIEYDKIGHMIATIDEQLRSQGDSNGVSWDTYIFNMEKNFSIPKNVAEQFFKGLQLNNDNKMDLLNLACKPYKLNRYLYRPLLIWKVDGNEFSFLGINAWTEALLQYATNAIPWGKAPKEWMKNSCFKNYVHRKEDAHDKWLENATEEIINEIELPYDRNVKTLNHKDGKTRIDRQGLGEVDFIVISKNTKCIYIIDCKHLMSRYDITNQRNDFNAFVENDKSYNETMSKKLKWFESKKHLITEHLLKEDNPLYKEAKNYNIEGIFVINTPTLYMYKSKYRIYTVDQIKKVFLDNFYDKEIEIPNKDGSKTFKVGYPYFKKPEHLSFELMEE